MTNIVFSLHPTDLPPITQDEVDEIAWEHSMLTWDSEDVAGIVDQIDHMRALYTNAAEQSLYWSSMALHMVAGFAAMAGIALPLKGEDGLQQAETQLLALARGVRAGLITTWVTTRLMNHDVPTDDQLTAEGAHALSPVQLNVRLLEA